MKENKNTKQSYGEEKLKETESCYQAVVLRRAISREIVEQAETGIIYNNFKHFVYTLPLKMC